MKQRRTKIASTIADRVMKDGGSKQLSREIAAYLLETRRVSDLNSIMRDVQLDWANDGYVEVIASSAHPITSDIKATITKQVTALYPKAKKIIITEAHDPELIGGVSLNLGDRQLDLSVEAKLNKFKQLTAAGKE